MAISANSIVTPQTIKTACVIVSAAQATFPPTTTPSNTTLLLTAGADGGRLIRLRAIPHETSAGVYVAQVFRSTDGGTTKYLSKATAGTNDTVSATDAPIELDFGFSEDNPMLLQANEKLYVANSIAKTLCFVAEWADY